MVVHSPKECKGDYSSMIKVVKSTVAKDGIRGLWRGAMLPLWTTTPIAAVMLVAYGEFLDYREAQNLKEAEANLTVFDDNGSVRP